MKTPFQKFIPHKPTPKKKKATKLTVATVNKALKAAGHPERLVQGNGYAYFTEGDAHLWPQSGVYVNRVTDVQDLQFWLDSYASLKAAYETNRLPKDPTPYRIGLTK